MSDATTRALLTRLAAQVAAGPVNVNTLVRSGIAGHLHANFDRIAGGHNVDPRNENKRVPRLVRPGAILLANLDADEDPSALVPRARFTHNQADCRDAIVNFAVDDDLDISELVVAEPGIVIGNAARVNLRVHANDQARIRIWRVTPAAANLQVGPPAVQVVVGPGVAAHHEVRNVLAPGGPIPAGWQQRFILEAITLPGDPTLPHPAVPPPVAPGVYRTPLAATSGGSEAAPRVNATDTAQPIYANRAPGDVWLELVHDIGGAVGAAPGAGDANLLDVGLFTIAPWIMTWNTLPCLRVYVAYLDAASRPVAPTFAQALREENHSMVWELKRGCSLARYCVPPIMPPVPNTTLRIPTNTRDQIRRAGDVGFFAIPAAVHLGDRWVQDEFEVGYCHAPHNWMHVVLHTPRGRPLATFVTDHMAHPRMGVFEAVHTRAAAVGGITGLSYGGNLEVSPPVPVASPALRRDSAGPAVKAHRPAPFGKIIMGDCTPRPNNDFLRNFLFAQRVQPILPVDTSWLAVGHVDEFMTFVRATGPRGFALLLNSVRLMTILLQEVEAVSAGETINRGKWRHSGGLFYDEHFVGDWLHPNWPNPGASSLRTYSERVEREKMSRLRARLKAGLDLTEEHIVSIPAYWEVPADVVSALGAGNNMTIAENVGMVNMLVANDHLMIPRPHGPRLSPVQARLVIGRVLRRWFGEASAPAIVMPVAAEEHTFWARPGESAWWIAAYFTRPPPGTANPKAWRTEIVEYINGTRLWAAVSGPQQAAVTVLYNAITPQITVAGGAVDEFGEWHRITIPDNTVDVIEVYMLSVLQNLGNTVHFIENFESYHADMGEVHCGTNAARQPPEQNPGFMDRWWDRGVYDPDYDTTYDPAR